MNFSHNVKLEFEDRMNITVNSGNMEFDLQNFRKEDDKSNMTRSYLDLNFDPINNHKKATDKIQSSDYLNNNFHTDILDKNRKQFIEIESNSRVKKLNDLMDESSVEIGNNFNSAIKYKFKERLNQMKTHTENILENIRSNFNNYVDDQKSHLINSLNSIENLFDVDSNTYQCENEKIKQLEKKMGALSNEINGLIQDLMKFSK